MLNNSTLRRNLPRLSPLAPWLENYSIVLSSGKTAANRIYVGVIKHYKDSKSFAICKLFAKKDCKKIRQPHGCLTLHDKRFKATKLPKEVSLQNRAILLLCALPARQIYMYLQPYSVS